MSCIKMLAGLYAGHRRDIVFAVTIASITSLIYYLDLVNALPIWVVYTTYLECVASVISYLAVRLVLYLIST